MTTRTLLDFIQYEQSTGATRDAIAQKLKTKGWGDADIAAAFAFLSEFSDQDVPTPPKGLTGEFCGMLNIMWRVYRSRWKRFLGAGLLYAVVCFFLALAVVMFALPVIPTFLSLVSLGDTSAAFATIVQYLFIGVCFYVVVQLWYMGMLYAIALKKGESLWERSAEGIRHLPAVLGIKIVTTLLLMILLVPLFLVTFLTQNLLVTIFFGPFFILGALALGFLLSLAIPAYFQGVPWRNAALTSIHVIRKNLLSVATFYLFFGILLFVSLVMFRHTGPIAVVFTLGVISPMEVLFMLVLYRRFTADTEIPAIPPPSRVKTKTPKTPKVLPA